MAITTQVFNPDLYYPALPPWGWRGNPLVRVATGGSPLVAALYTIQRSNGGPDVRLFRSWNSGDTWEYVGSSREVVSPDTDLSLEHLTADTDGKLFCHWLNSNVGGSYLAVSSDAGATWTSTALDDTFGATHPVEWFLGMCSGLNGSIHIFWTHQDEYGLYQRIYHASRNRSGSWSSASECFSLVGLFGSAGECQIEAIACLCDTTGTIYLYHSCIDTPSGALLSVKDPQTGVWTQEGTSLFSDHTWEAENIFRGPAVLTIDSSNNLYLVMETLDMNYQPPPNYQSYGSSYSISMWRRAKATGTWQGNHTSPTVTFPEGYIGKVSNHATHSRHPTIVTTSGGKIFMAWSWGANPPSVWSSGIRLESCNLSAFPEFNSGSSSWNNDAQAWYQPDAVYYPPGTADRPYVWGSIDEYHIPSATTVSGCVMLIRRNVDMFVQPYNVTMTCSRQTYDVNFPNSQNTVLATALTSPPTIEVMSNSLIFNSRENSLLSFTEETTGLTVDQHVDTTLIPGGIFAKTVYRKIWAKNEHSSSTLSVVTVNLVSTEKLKGTAGLSPAYSWDSLNEATSYTYSDSVILTSLAPQESKCFWLRWVITDEEIQNLTSFDNIINLKIGIG